MNARKRSTVPSARSRTHRKMTREADKCAEQAYRRGCHQALEFVLYHCETLHDPEALVPFLQVFCGILKTMRYDRKPHRGLLHEALDQVKYHRHPRPGPQVMHHALATELRSVYQQLDWYSEAAQALHDALTTLTDALLSLPRPITDAPTVTHLQLVLRQALRTLDTHRDLAGGAGV